MKKFNLNCEVLSIERQRSSYEGNPCFKFELMTKDYVFFAKTATNASCAYMVTLSMEHKIYNFVGHYTKNGNAIIDFINKI